MSDFWYSVNSNGVNVGCVYSQDYYSDFSLRGNAIIYRHFYVYYLSDSIQI